MASSVLASNFRLGYTQKLWNCNVQPNFLSKQVKIGSSLKSFFYYFFLKKGFFLISFFFYRINFISVFDIFSFKNYSRLYNFKETLFRDCRLWRKKRILFFKRRRPRNAFALAFFLNYFGIYNRFIPTLHIWNTNKLNYFYSLGYFLLGKNNKRRLFLYWGLLKKIQATSATSFFRRRNYFRKWIFCLIQNLIYRRITRNGFFYHKINYHLTPLSPSKNLLRYVSLKKPLRTRCRWYRYFTNRTNVILKRQRKQLDIRKMSRRALYWYNRRRRKLLEIKRNRRRWKSRMRRNNKRRRKSFKQRPFFKRRRPRKFDRWRNKDRKKIRKSLKKQRYKLYLFLISLFRLYSTKPLFIQATIRRLKRLRVFFKLVRMFIFKPHKCRTKSLLFNKVFSIFKLFFIRKQSFSMNQMNVFLLLNRKGHSFRPRSLSTLVNTSFQSLNNIFSLFLKLVVKNKKYKIFISQNIKRWLLMKQFNLMLSIHLATIFKSYVLVFNQFITGFMSKGWWNFHVLVQRWARVNIRFPKPNFLLIRRVLLAFIFGFKFFNFQLFLRLLSQLFVRYKRRQRGLIIIYKLIIKRALFTLRNVLGIKFILYGKMNRRPRARQILFYRGSKPPLQSIFVHTHCTAKKLITDFGAYMFRFWIYWY